MSNNTPIEILCEDVPIQRKDTKKEITTDLNSKLKSHADNLYLQLELFLQGKKPNFGNIMFVVVNLMQIVEKYPKLNGDNRKTLILHVLRKYMANKIGKDSDVFSDLINTLIPAAVDIIVALDKNKIKIEAKKFWKKWNCCS